MSVHQVLVAAAPHDAVTGQALALRPELEAFGPSEIFARHVDPSLADRVHRLEAFPARRVDALVVHASIGEPDVAAFLLERSEPLVLVYHNVTPPRFFADWDPPLAALLEAGRRELRLLRGRTATALADSEYNAAELREMGFDDVRVTGLVVDAARLAPPDDGHRPGAGVAHRTGEDEPDEDAGGTGAAAEQGPSCLFVGQLLPHKRPDFLLQAYHVLRTHLAPRASLVLVGADRAPRYGRAVRQLAAELALPDVRFAGSVGDAELGRLFGAADVFVTASEHEGFCLPAVEAMARSVPVVARGFAALPDTVGGAGVVLPPDDGPVVMAEAVHEVATDARLHEALVRRGHERLADLDPAVARRAFAEAVGEVVA